MGNDTENDCTPFGSYTEDVKRLRAAEARPESFEDKWKKSRAHELECERTEMEARWAVEPQPRLTVAQEADLEAYRAPFAYCEDIKKLQAALKQGR